MKTRGRKKVCNGNQRRHIASLCQNRTAQEVQKILTSKTSKVRSKNLFPNPIALSTMCIRAYAKEFGVTPKDGRGNNAGRKASLTEDQQKLVAALVKMFNGNQVVQILAAERGEKAKVRKANGFSKPVKLTYPTVVRYARLHNDKVA